MKKKTKKSGDQIAEKGVESLVSSRGVVATIRVTDNGTLDINVKGRPSGKIDGKHGDHVTAQILPIHGIRRAAHGTRVSDIDNVRDIRSSIFNFISSIAVLNRPRSGDGMKLSAALEDTGEEVSANPNDAVAPLYRLYARIDEILDEYNKKRYKETELRILEKTFNLFLTNHGSDNPNFFIEEDKVIKELGGLRAIYDSHIAQNRESNRDLICGTFGRLIEAISTYYYQIPNTAFPVISGYEASESEGGNVAATLSRLDEICEKLEEARERNISSGRPKRSSVVKTLSNIAKEVAQGELNGLESKSKLSEDEEVLNNRIEKLSSISNNSTDSLQYIALKLKNLFHYPEIGNEVSVEDKGSRNNNAEEFYDQIARHLFIVFNVYPELVQDIEDKNKIVGHFINEVIYHETDLGVDRGWPSLRSIGMDVHIDEVNDRLNQLSTAKADNLYTNTEGYRSRASSGAIDDIKEGIINPAIDFIRKNFGLEKGRLEELETQLGMLNLGADESEFRREVMKSIMNYCEKEMIPDPKIQRLQDILFLNTGKLIGKSI